ncbi:diguanylate cyclase domain-containing protein [Marinospirillum sp.]|uniref:diguanylate cyclase domain-containing protein n=1 Tax=Marinospirillum sp. TaxID=2183934 RepID=UPI0028708DF5|nr:diguanylate cyclase [Marinospirillum sp.]MDR9468902.1 diguanylate cyclase [Marinospirillum sp.]
MRKSRYLRRGLGFIGLVLLTASYCLAQEEPDWVISQAGQQPLSEHFSVYRHSGSSLSLQAVQALDAKGAFEPAQTGKPAATNFGLTRDEVWMRLRFSTPEELPERWLLEIAHASLDRVELYLSANQQDYEYQRSGDLLTFSQRSFQHRHPVFDLTLQPETDYTLYLRVASEGTLSVPVTLWRPDALWQQDQLSYSLLSAYYGLLVALLVYNLFLFLSLRDPLYLTYVAFISTLAVGQAGLTGFTGQFIWPDNAWLAHLSPTGGVSAAGFFGALFVHSFLGNTPRRLRLGWLMPMISLGYALTFLATVFWSYYHGAIAVNLISLVFAFTALSLGAVSFYHRQPGARFFVLAWVALLTGVLVISLHNLGLLPSNFLTSNALLIGSALEMLLLSLALADRINRIQQARDEAQAQSIQLRQEMVETLEKSERQLEERVAERTSALEEANRELQKSHHLLEYQAHHDALTGLANRKLLSQHFKQVKCQADEQNMGFTVVVADLDKFKQINDTWGHQAGDEVLITLARRLLAAVNHQDTLARVGGDEFVALLPGLQDRQLAEQYCQQLLRTAIEPIVLSQGTTIIPGISLGYAIYPQDTTDIDQLLNLADKAMYQNKLSNTLGFN